MWALKDYGWDIAMGWSVLSGKYLKNLQKHFNTEKSLKVMHYNFAQQWWLHSCAPNGLIQNWWYPGQSTGRSHTQEPLWQGKIPLHSSRLTVCWTNWLKSGSYKCIHSIHALHVLCGMESSVVFVGELTSYPCLALQYHWNYCMPLNFNHSNKLWKILVHRRIDLKLKITFKEHIKCNDFSWTVFVSKSSQRQEWNV